MSPKSIFLVIFLAIGGLAAGVVVKQSIAPATDTDKQAASTATNNEASPAKDVAASYSLQDIEGKLRHASEWEGKVRLVNFWASWCPPCVREIPAFIQLQEKYGGDNFTLVGIALDEKQAVIDFIDPIGANYPILIAEQEGIALTKAYGNRLGVLPYTALVDKNGKIIQTFMREMSFEEAEQVIKPYLSQTTALQN